MEDSQREPVQRGRYAIYEGDGGFIVQYTRGLCETCAECGCGEQAAEPLDFTPRGLPKTIFNARKAMGAAGMKLPMFSIGGDGGPRRGR